MFKIQPLILTVACLTPLRQDYGGFLTLTMLKSTDGLIRCAAAQAPVVDWTMYGEREVKLKSPRTSGT